MHSGDYLITEAGAGGGRVVASGTPEEVARSRKSHTAPYLRAALFPARVAEGNSAPRAASSSRVPSR